MDGTLLLLLGEGSGAHNGESSMRTRTTLAAIFVATVGLLAPVTAFTAPANADTVSASVASHVCTKTSSGRCIRGGQFCPQSKYGRSGWDAYGRRYVCKGDRSHPHWMKP